MPAVRANKRAARVESNKLATKRVTRSSKKAPAVQPKVEAPAVQSTDAEDDSDYDSITLFIPSDDDGDDEFAVKKYTTHRRPWYFSTRLTPEMCPWYATANEPTYSPTDPLALLTPAQ
jgi:hypothetical protein